MKHFRNTTIIGLAGLCFFMTACSGQKPEATKTSPEKAKVENLQTTPADIRKEAGDLTRTTMTYAEEQKKIYTQKVLDRLSLYNQKMMKLDREFAMLSDQAKADMASEIGNFNSQKEKVAEKVRELQTAGVDVYGELKEGMNLAIENMDKAYEQAMDRLQKK